MNFDFWNCTNEDADIEVEDTNSEAELFNDEIEQTEQIFDFIIVSSFISLYSESSIEPLYFVQVTGKGVAEEDISNPYGHYGHKRWCMFQGLYLKLLCSKDAKIKWFSTLTTGIVNTPDETYSIYVDFNNDLEWDIYVYNMSVRKASYWDFMFIVP